MILVSRNISLIIFYQLAHNNTKYFYRRYEMKRSELTRSEYVKCKATNCIHNKATECMAGVINISGMNAMSTPQTGCATFVEEGGYAYDHLSNLYDNEKSITQIKDIKCLAKNCKHNNSGECYADGIRINAADTSCETFECN